MQFEFNKEMQVLVLDYTKISARILCPSNKQRTIKKHPSVNSKTLALDWRNFLNFGSAIIKVSKIYQLVSTIVAVETIIAFS